MSQCFRRTRFCVRIWEEMQDAVPSVDVQIVALTPRDAVVAVCKRERIARADWVQVTSDGTKILVSFLDVTVSSTGWFRYEASY